MPGLLLKADNSQIPAPSKLCPFQAVLFDFDGVVVLSEHLYDEATAALARELELDIPPEFNTRMRGQSDTVFFDALKREFAVPLADEELYELGRQTLRDVFASTIHHTDGYLEFHERIRQQGLSAGLVTSTPRKLLEHVFRHSDLTLDFDEMVTVDDVTRPKPDPEPYRLMCRRLGVDPTQALVIEDSPAGVTAARTAGCQVIAITTSTDPGLLGLADFVVDSFREVSELLPF